MDFDKLYEECVSELESLNYSVKKGDILSVNSVAQISASACVAVLRKYHAELLKTFPKESE